MSLVVESVQTLAKKQAGADATASPTDATSPPDPSDAERDGSRTIATFFAAVLAMCATVGLWMATPSPTPILVVPPVVLILAFAATEATALHIESRRETHGISMSAFPLLIGLLAVSPVMLVATRLIGAGFSLAFVRGRRGMQLLWTTAIFAAETAVAALIAAVVLVDGTVTGSADWLVLLGALLAAELVSFVAIPLFIALSEGDYQQSLFAQVARSQAIAAMGAAFAILVAAAAIETPALLVLGVVPSIGVSLLMRFAGMLGKKYADLTQLHHFTAAIGGAKPDEVGLQQLTDTLRARGAVLALPRVDGDHDVRSLIDGVRNDHLLRFTGLAASGAKPTRVLDDDAGPNGALLRLFNASNGLVADLQGIDGGFALVFDRTGTAPRFSPEERELFGSMAATLGSRLSADTLLRKLETQARIDTLTGLANRSTFEAGLETRLADPDSRGAVLIIDLDRFKEVNDSLGHGFGDEVLRTIANRLSSVVADGGIAARLGGDEFAVIIDDNQLAPLSDRLDRIADTLSMPIELDGIVLDLGGSIGVAEWPAHGTSTVALLRDADIAMYEAKRRHESWVRFDPSLDSHGATDRLALMGQLRDAITNGELTVFYQPQVRSTNGYVVGAEALVRWIHPTNGIIPPDEFINHAEHSNVAGFLTRFVIESAATAAKRLADLDQDVVVSINLTSRDLLDRTLPEFVAAEVERQQISAHLLGFEVTETSVIADIDAAIANLGALRDLGCKTSVDDFGTGHASLRYLQRLPLDEAKIDRSFVEALTTNAGDEAIVRSMTVLFHELGLEVVAEGAEDDATMAMLAGFGCDLIQGYHVSPPVPLDDFLRFSTQPGRSGQPLATVTPIRAVLG
ncbi:MAG: EAL domain-containing protein [Actinomycetota bacterium]